MLVRLRLRSKVLVCPCGRVNRARYDTSRRRWRHVNFGAWRVVLEAEIRRAGPHRVDAMGSPGSRAYPWFRGSGRVAGPQDVEGRCGRNVGYHLETVDAL